MSDNNTYHGWLLSPIGVAMPVNHALSACLNDPVVDPHLLGASPILFKARGCFVPISRGGTPVLLF